METPNAFARRDIKSMAKWAHMSVKTFYESEGDILKCPIFWSIKGLIMPDEKFFAEKNDYSTFVNAVKTLLDRTHTPYTLTINSRLWDVKKRKVIHEDALMTLSTDGYDRTYRIMQPFTFRIKNEKKVFRWFKSNHKESSHLEKEILLQEQQMTPEQERLINYIESTWGFSQEVDE